MRSRLFLIIIYSIFLALPSLAQVTIGEGVADIDYASPKEYEIGGITVSGVKYLDNNALIMIAGINIGDKIEIPGEEISDAIKNLWRQRLFEKIKISATKVQGDIIFLDIFLTERARLSKFSFNGVRRSEADNLREDLNIVTGDVVTENVIIRSKEKIRNYFIDKGHLNVEVNIIQKKDTTLTNAVILDIHIKKNPKIKINKIYIHGNENLGESKIKGSFKETKEMGVIDPFGLLDSLFLNIPKYIFRMNSDSAKKDIKRITHDRLRLRIFKSSKFIQSEFSTDKQNVINKYNEHGFRDAFIVSDSSSKYSERAIDLHLTVSEGNKYYFRDISFVGNTKYTTNTLKAILGIRKGDIYNQKILDANLSFNPSGLDISSLYLDDGYLFFSLNPVEVRVENDSIDLEIRIREGKQAIINRVTLKGNTKTNDHVAIREMRTRPGRLFSRSDIIRTTRELAQLKYFNAETINPVPIPNPIDGTVDIEYEVEETSSDQIELSGGWGYGRIIGTLGLSFNNFSLRKMLKPSTWRPVPTGDGQKLSLRFQSYGTGYMSFSTSFTEPWLGGKKPNAFSVSYVYSIYSNGLPKVDPNRYSFIINGVTLGLGKRLKWPDDFFSMYHSLSYQNYKLHNYSAIFAFSNGTSNSLSYTNTISRNSIDAPIYPRSGSELSFSLQFTPPFSLFSNKEYHTLTDEEKFKWQEFHKWKISGAWYSKLIGDMVLRTKIQYGFLGKYNNDLPITPFERFYLGGDGLSGYNNLDGREIIGMRGYANESITPEHYLNPNLGGTIFSKYTLELRYPLSLNPNATIFVMGFMDAGNSWLRFDTFDPFDLKRAAGFGVRVFLPMFGVLGLDWGYGFDPIPGKPGANGSQFHFSINGSLD